MINTLYSKDISRKVSTALKAQMESGEFKKRNLPYGYRWDEEHSNMVFDEKTAPIVQKIFQWKIEGLSLPAIADRLDAMNAPNPEFQSIKSASAQAMLRQRRFGISPHSLPFWIIPITSEIPFSDGR